MMVAKKFLFQATCFDLDGVILDTEFQYTMFWHDMALKYAPEEKDLEYKIKGQTIVLPIFRQGLTSINSEQERVGSRLAHTLFRPCI